MVAGIATLLIWLVLGYNTLMHEVFLALTASIVVYVICALGHSRRVDLNQLLTGD
jgi:hypothetical protein